MAVTAEMVGIACRLRPRFACLVPERRQERTTEGGLDILGNCDVIRDACARLAGAGIAVALFVAPDIAQLDAIVACGAPHVEIHTGHYADSLTASVQTAELERILAFATAARAAGLEVHAGHGLNMENVPSIAAAEDIVELNIGHAIVARALLVGMPTAVAEMRRTMVEARFGLTGGS
jgi:pyridoxine 5-phosphate synthase